MKPSKLRPFKHSFVTQIYGGHVFGTLCFRLWIKYLANSNQQEPYNETLISCGFIRLQRTIHARRNYFIMTSNYLHEKILVYIIIQMHLTVMFCDDHLLIRRYVLLLLHLLINLHCRPPTPYLPHSIYFTLLLYSFALFYLSLKYAPWKAL